MWNELLTWEKIILIYLAAVSLISVIITVYDKKAAVNRPNERIPEAKLFLLALLGGSFAMYLTMQSIRHKTKHLRFMVGIPFIMIVQIVLAYLLYYILL
ncbi:MAG: DUF1294 domain-containing protein [Clostridia bacterium]|nr:DUF1294 domain-containing protein [Clostridia bacterium]